MTAKLLYSGTTHTTGGSDGAARSTDGILDIKLPEPHPTAEVLFAAAWSACFIGAIGVAAAQRKIALPATPAIDATIDLLRDGGEFFLRARLDVTVPGIDRDVAQTLIDAAHAICPYSKATSGNIEVELNLV
jgi:lipoyl-dependent peroxiredoxin